MKLIFVTLAALLALAISQFTTADKPAHVNMGDSGSDVIAAVATEPIRTERKVFLGLPIEILVFSTDPELGSLSCLCSLRIGLGWDREIGLSSGRSANA